MRSSIFLSLLSADALTLAFPYSNKEDTMTAAKSFNNYPTVPTKPTVNLFTNLPTVPLKVYTFPKTTSPLPTTPSQALTLKSVIMCGWGLST